MTRRGWQERRWRQMGGERPYTGRVSRRRGARVVVRVFGRGGKGTGRKRQGGRKRQEGGEVGGRPDEDGQMERPFGSSERVSKSDPFSSNNRLSISRTFPGTPPNNHILPFPDVLAQTPRFNYPLIRLRSAALAPSQNCNSLQ